jgi:glycosyltransferase involved in cell wall biosynthesis
MKKLRIAVWHNLPGGGGKRQLYNHVRGLVERGHFVEAWCPDTAEREFLPLSDIVTEHVVALKSDVDAADYNSKDYKVVRKLLNAMEKHCELCAEQINAGDFDVLFANSCVLFRTTPIAKYVTIPSAIYLGEPYRQFYEALPELPWIAPMDDYERTFSLRDIPHYVGRLQSLGGIRLQARAELEFARAFDLILVNSAFSRESILRAFNLESKVCYLGIDTAHYSPTGEPKENFIVGIGYIYHGKGVDRAIRALSTIPKEKRPSLVWVGNSASQHDLQNYTALAKSLEVDFVPKIHIPDAEVISLLSRALAMVYTSRLEPFGLAPLEANACGTPVVAIAEGGVRETIKEGVNGFLTNADDPEMVGNLIVKFIDDPKLSVRMGMLAREFVVQHWNMQFCIDNIESHLTGLVERDGMKRIRDLLVDHPELDKLAIPADIKMNVEESRVFGGLLHMKGWAFIDDGESAINSRIFVVLRGRSGFRLIPADTVSREDVTAFFGGKINYDQSGFAVGAKFSFTDFSDIAVIIKRGDKISLRVIKDKPTEDVSESEAVAESRKPSEDRMRPIADMGEVDKLIATSEIIYFSRLLPKVDGDGGFRRTAQIVETLKGIDCTFVSALDFHETYNTPGYMKSAEYQEYLNDDALSSAYLEKWIPRRRNTIAYLHHVSWIWQRRLQNNKTVKLVIVDDPIYFEPLVRYLARNGIPTVAHCHNIESLSRSQLIEADQAQLMSHELELLSLCSLVVTIAREESVFLNNLGCYTFFYPYFPIGETLDRMLKMRQKRSGSPQKGFLILGTANNPPTMAGMVDMIKQWPEINKTVNSDLFVGGFGTESLKELAGGKGIIFKGVMSDEELDEMLWRIKACIVYQGDGSGALTKICEFLIAGVPVLANSHAARSYYNVPGVVEFTDFHDLAKGIRRLDSEVIKVYDPKAPSPDSLIAHIKELIGDCSGLQSAKAVRQAEKIYLAEKWARSYDTAGDESKNSKVTSTDKFVKLKEEYDVMAAELAAITAKGSALASERDALAAQREALLHSLSWRVTAPLRYVGKFFMGRQEKR